VAAPSCACACACACVTRCAQDSKQLLQLWQDLDRSGRGDAAELIEQIITTLMGRDPNNTAWYEDRAKLRERMAASMGGAGPPDSPMVVQCLLFAADDWIVLSKRVSIRDRTHMHALFSASKIFERLDRYPTLPAHMHGRAAACLSVLPC
jgi:hypothetical protein